MKVIFVCEEYFETEGGEKVYFFEPLEKEIPIEAMQKIVDRHEELVTQLNSCEYLEASQFGIMEVEEIIKILTCYSARKYNGRC